MHQNNLIGWLDGICIFSDDIKIIFDPIKTGLDKDAIVFISHAHSDHTRGFLSNNVKYSTIETKQIYESLVKRDVTNFNKIQVNRSIKIDDVKITAINSGHMLGSVQYIIETPEKVILYTGDLNCVDTLITKAADRIKCDALIIEGTYGNPQYVFPLRDKIYSNIVEWALNMVTKKIPLFHVYSAGKAQEIIKLFNIYTNLPVKVDERVASVCMVYNIFMTKPLSYVEWFDKEYNGNGPSVHISSSTKGPDRVKFVEARATGWSIRFRGGRYVYFPLSGHADFRQLVHYVKDVAAKEVYIFTGFSDHMVEYLDKKLNITARSIPLISQRMLTQFY